MIRHGLVEFGVDRNAAAGACDCRRRVGQRHDRTALQQPNEAGAVVSRQAAVARMRPLWRLVQAEQVCRAPIQRLGLLAPLANECPRLGDALVPTILGNVRRGSQLEMSEGAAISQARCRDLDDGDFAAVAVRLSRDCLIGRTRLGRLRLR